MEISRLYKVELYSDGFEEKDETQKLSDILDIISSAKKGDEIIIKIIK